MITVLITCSQVAQNPLRYDLFPSKTERKYIDKVPYFFLGKQQEVKCCVGEGLKHEK